MVYSEVIEVLRSSLTGERLQARIHEDFKDYVKWQLNQDSDLALEYWEQTLEGFSTPTPLPSESAGLDRQRSGVSATVDWTVLEPDQTASAIQFVRDQHVTLSTILQASWSIVLAAQSGQHDVVFGVTRSGRSAPLDNIDSMVGCLINTLPLRVQLEASQRWIDLVESIHSSNMSMFLVRVGIAD